jgi:D-arabinitol dehydrogenase (NADP+)
MAAGLCGTDRHIYLGDYYSSFPLIPGHEFSGIVTKIGRNVKGFKEGQRMATDPNIFCEKCQFCKENIQNFCQDFEAIGVTKNGAFAQYVVAPEASVFDIGEMDFVRGALILSHWPV